MMKRKLTAILLSLALVVGSAFQLPEAMAAEKQVATDYATRGEVTDMVLAAADQYNKSLSKENIIKGYKNGETKESQPITRTEAFVMISRAFGALPAPQGDNLRSGLFPQAFTDVPAWAKADIDNLRKVGVITGTGDDKLGGSQNVTSEQVNVVIKRIYSLFGSSLKDDYYATINKESLDKSEIRAGEMVSNSFSDVQEINNKRIESILEELSKGTYQKGTKEQKISDFYKNVSNMDSRNAQGIAPIKNYLDTIDRAVSAKEVFAVSTQIMKDMGVGTMINFSATTDAKNSEQHIMAASYIAPNLSKEMYLAEGAVKDAYITYLTTLLELGGETADAAKKHAQDYFSMEKDLSAHQMNPQEYGDIDKIYNIYTLDQLQKLFPDADLAGMLSAGGYQKPAQIMVTDKGLLEALAPYLNDSNLEQLKTTAKLNILLGFGSTLQQDFEDASVKLNQAIYAIEGKKTPEEMASLATQQYMGSYVGQIFTNRYFSKEAKQDVENMVKDFIGVYKERIGKLTWMSADTKKMALNKLDTMKVKVGYPDDWSDPMDQTEIKSGTEGGSYFGNVAAYAKAAREKNAADQNRPVDRSAWGMYAFTVNAMYDATQNSITFPAGILQEPFYNIKAKREANLGAIGTIIAHEITHAFDNNGAKFDEKGNAANWWTDADYKAFQELCGKAVSYYDGAEAATGIKNNGTLTLSENVADLGGMACALEAAAKMGDPDYDAFFKANARVWRMAATREYRQYLTQMDVHSPDKLRTNYVVVNFQPFYDTYEVKAGDGMYVAPEDRVSIW